MESSHGPRTRSNGAIAVVGIGCRFANSETPERFWNNLVAGMDAIIEVPKDRFDVDALYDPRPTVPGRCMTRWGSFIDDVHAFDHAYFRLSPREARRMDPQQRVLLEVAAEALDDACLPERALSEFQTGVFIGSCYNDWETHILGDADRIDLYTCTGATRCTLSGRISFAFNLQGPSMTVDAGCASSLLSIHLACQSLWSGETNLALAGGVNLILEPGWTIGFSQAQMLSPDGHCKTFDSRGNGFVRADGCGVVVLMPLERAEQLNAAIYAVIRGSGASNDGATNGLLATPSVIGQANALRAAYLRAGMSPHDVQYIETHGTGTPAGDPVEVAAISSVMQGRAQPCLLGSVKTNIGHTEGAAGVAGFIKTCLALQHRMIPKTLHFEQPNPKIVWDGSVSVADELCAWPEGVARAGVSSFGISGTDVHVVLEEHRRAPMAESSEDTGPQLLCLSATSPEGLVATADAYVEYLGRPSTAAFAQVCRTAALGRNHQVHRLAVVARDRADAASSLRAFVAGEPIKGAAQGRTREHAHGPVFVFSGQGSQWAGMGAELLEHEPVFRRALEACDRALLPYTGWSVLESLLRRADPQQQSIDVIQPTLFAVQVAIAALWRAWGVEPSLVIGHSMGEIAAAHLVGTLSLDDAARVVCSRSQLLARTSGQGGMLAVELSFAHAERAIARFGGELGIAVSNSPTATVLSGEPRLLRELKAELEQREVFCRFIAADVAGHSPQLDPLLPELARALEGIRPNATSTAPMFSTVAAGLLEPHAFDAQYWVRNLRQPVRFSESVQALLAQGYDTFIEISPHPILRGPVQQLIEHARQTGSVHESLRRDEDARFCMRAALGELHVVGQAPDLTQLFGEPRSFVALPPYVWQRERFDADAGDVDRVPQRNSHGRRAEASDAGVLGAGVKSALHAGTYFFETVFSLERVPYLADHKVRDVALLPGAAYVDMALTALSEVFGSGQIALQQMQFDRALPIGARVETRVQLVLSADARGASLKFFGMNDDSAAWLPLATLTALRDDCSALPAARDLSALRPALSAASVDEHYRAAETHGIDYGPGFRGVRELWLGTDVALARVALPASVPVDRQRQPAHTALLDACWQTFAALVFREGARDSAADAFLPVAVGRVRQHAALGIEVWAHAQLRAADAKCDRLVGDLVLCDNAGRVLMEVDGLEVQRLAAQNPQASLDGWLYELTWQKAPREQRAVALSAQQLWLVFADRRAQAGARVVRALQKAGVRCVVVQAGSGFEASEPDRFVIDPKAPEHVTRVIDAVAHGGVAIAGVVHLWSLDAASERAVATHDLTRSQELSCISVAHVVQALSRAHGQPQSPQLCIVTQGSQRVLESDAVEPLQAPVWALARVLRYEHPELRTRCFDLSAAAGAVEWQQLLDEISDLELEDQLALRGAERYAMRFTRGANAAARPPTHASAEHFKLEIERPGILDHLQLRAAVRCEPGPDEVEIEVQAAALNFLDVLRAMGNYPGQDAGPVALGLECAGRVSRLGADVRGLSLGQEVVAVVHSGRTAIGKYVVTHAELVAPKPAQLSFEQVVTLPVAFLTAHYALAHVGRLARGERVLIHSAAGGVGLAALQLARAAGAEIFCTAGSARKRQWLSGLGVKYVGDSRALAFADEIRALTHGEGVDVVLNSLPGDAISHGLGLLRADGRFLEIGKRDLVQNLQLGLSPFERGLSFAHVDIARLIRERPRFIGELLRALLERAARGELEPLPASVFPVSQAADAFREMAQGTHVGKIVLSFADPALPAAVQANASAPLAADGGAYLITGGLGGLGLASAGFLVQEGARQLVLIGRAAPSEAAEHAIQQLEAQGARVWVRSCDVADRAQLEALLDELRREALPLRGIVHAAGVLQDGLVMQLTAASFERVLQPKLLGAWNLHALTRELSLDFFVLYSSGAASLGSPGQGNYAAANAFMDALAQHRRASGLAALSVNWGPWGEVGLAVRPDRADRLGQRGLPSMTNQQAFSVLGRLLRQGAVNTTVFPDADWRTWAQYYPVAAKLPMLQALLSESGPSARALQKSELQRIAAALPEARAQLVERYVLEQMSRVLKVAAHKQLDPELALTRLGIDSLMALELKNRIEADLQVVVPVSKILLGPSARKLALDVLDKLDLGQTEQDLAVAVASVDAMSDAQVEAQLAELLELQALEVTGR